MHHQKTDPPPIANNARRRSRIGLLAIGVPFVLVLAACESKAPPPSAAAPAAEHAAPQALPAGPARVEVAAAGFQPSRVELGDDHRIVFRRTSDATCATAVAFPDLGVEKQLPLNADVTVELPPTAKGELTFQCGMGMYRGKVVAR
jgi:hypothetical protein